MSKTNRELLEKKLKSIDKGSYYFGIIGRLSVFIGILGLIMFLFTIILSGFNSEIIKKLSGDALQCIIYIIYGGLFIIARDAFDAIKALINELNEIV